MHFKNVSIRPKWFELIRFMIHLNMSVIQHKTEVDAEVAVLDFKTFRHAEVIHKRVWIHKANANASTFHFAAS